MVVECIGESDPLPLCAVLRWFNSEQLQELACASPEQIAQLLASHQVIESPTAAGYYQIQPDLRSALLSQLRADRPADEAELHTVALRYFLSKLERVAVQGCVEGYEDACLYHLHALFTQGRAYVDWNVIVDFAQALQERGPALARYQPQLVLYEGYAAIRIQNYARGELLLSELIEHPTAEPWMRIEALKGLADAAWYHSRYDRSFALYQQLYTTATEIDDAISQGIALLNMGLIYHGLEQYEQAFAHCERSLQIFHSQGDRVREAHARYHTALYSLYLGRWHDAEEHCASAQLLFERLGMDSYRGFVYWIHGYLQYIFGDEPAAEAYYLRALPLAESPEHGQPSLAMDVWLYLGLLYHTQERWDMALEHYEHALAFATRLDRKHQVAMIDFRRGQAFQRLGQIDAAYAAYQAAIDGIEALGGATEGDDVKISLFGTTQQLYEAMVLLCLDLGRPAEAFHYVERARSRAFLDTLVKKSPELYEALDRSAVTLADVQAGLSADALLLEYYTTGVLPVGEHLINSIPESNERLRGHLTLPPRIVLFAITRNHFAVHRLALNPNHLRPPEGDRYPGRHLLHGRLPQHLYGQLLAPAAALLAGRERLYVIPHGPLHYVPFTALRSAAGEYLLRAGGPALAHAPSATILLRNCLGRPPAHGSTMLALGFNDPLGEQPLRYAEAEAQHVARILGGEAWVGPEPKSERLIAAGRDVRWLHIAGHARFDPRDPLGSALSLGPGDALSARAIIRDLDLSADLVTLSSCTSGVSHVVPGDELLGLQRALLYAGAPAVICTRWEARDLVALLVMDHFYSALRQGQAPGPALRDAQVAVRELTSQELAALLGRWNAQQDAPAIALDTPAAALQGVRALAAELADLDLRAIRDSWRGVAPDLAAALEQPAAVQSAPDAQPFADPLYWAPFMLVGRA